MAQSSWEVEMTWKVAGWMGGGVGVGRRGNRTVQLAQTVRCAAWNFMIEEEINNQITTSSTCAQIKIPGSRTRVGRTDGWGWR